MELTPEKRKFIVVGGILSVIAFGSLITYVVRSNYLNSCEDDLTNLIQIYSDKKKVSSLISDSSLAKKYFENLESQNCKDKKRYDSLYKKLVAEIRKSKQVKPVAEFEELPAISDSIPEKIDR